MILAVDIGGTKIAVALVDGDRIVERRTAPSPMHGDFTKVPAVVAELCGDWPQRCDRMGVATAGLVEGDRIRFVSRAERPSLALVDELGKLCGHRAAIVNDAWAGALGEYVHGGLSRFETVAYVTVSTGIGAGLIHQGRLLTSQNGLMAHLGHMSAGLGSPEAVRCNCGRTNCIETRASGTAIERRGSEILGRSVSAREVFELEGSNPALAGMLDSAAVELADVLLNARALCGVDCFVLGGSVGLVPAFFTRIERNLSGLDVPWAVPIRQAVLGKNAEIFGAVEAAKSPILQSIG